MDAEMFLDEYPPWKVGGPHCPIILQGMFAHAAESGQKEAERLIYQGHWQGLLRLNPEANVPAIQLVGYQTWRRAKGGLLQPLCGPAAKLSPTPGPEGETTQMMKPSRRSGRLTGGLWRPATCWS